MKHYIHPHLIITISSHKDAEHGIKRDSDRADGEVKKEEEGDGEEKTQQPLTRPSGTLSPRGEGKYVFTAIVISHFLTILIIGDTNILLAPWGEDAHRAGEGLSGLGAGSN